MLAMASYPTYQPSIFVGRKDPKKLAPAAQREGRRRRQPSGLQPRDQRRLSAGLDVQAGDCARGDARRADAALRHDPVHADVQGSRLDVQELDAADRHGDDADDCDRRSPATRTSTSSAGASTTCRPTAATRCRPGRTASGFGETERPRRRPGESRPDRDARVAEEGLPGQRRLRRARSHLEAGLLDPDGDRPEPGARDAAPDGALLRDDRERRQAGDAARRRRRRADGREGPGAARAAALRRRVAATDRRRPDGADLRAARPRRGDSLAGRNLLRRLRLVPRRHRRQDGKRREAGHPARVPARRRT